MRRGFAIRPVKSEKEEVTFSHLAQDSSATQTVTIALAENSPTTAGDVEIGDTIKSFFFEINFGAEVTTSPKIVHWILVKNPLGGTISGSPATQDSTYKRFIFKRGMEMLPRDVGTVTKRIGVVRIPPRFRRMGDADQLQFRYICTSSEQINVCGNFIYKHFG